MPPEETSYREACLPNSCEYITHTDRGDFLVQVAWPLGWSEDRLQPDDDNQPVSTLYLVDSNAYFFTAVDITRRLEFLDNARTVVVGVGYPKSNCVYDWRRGPDLTPPTPDGKYTMPLGRNGKPRTDLTFGQADKFLDFIQDQVMPHVHDSLFPAVPLQAGRKALFGHSYGGVFTLHTLFTRPHLFDFYIAASPTIWWSNYALVKHQEAQLHARKEAVHPPRSLFMSWGDSEDELQQGTEESEALFEKRKAIAEGPEMRDSAASLVTRMEACPSIKNIWTCHLPTEDHGSSSVVGLQKGIMKFLIGKD